MRSVLLVSASVLVLSAAFVVGCEGGTSSGTPTTFDAGSTTFDGGSTPPPGPVDAGSAPVDAGADAAEAGKVLPPGFIDPVPYLSFADSPFKGVAFPSYWHLEDFEGGALATPGVTADSTTMSSTFGAAAIDSVDGDDGTIDGKCQKAAGTCEALYGNGSLTFTFDAAALGALPTHVGLAWTDGGNACDVTFEAFDENDVSLGTKVATSVGDDSIYGTVAEDRFFGVVRAAGIKKIKISNSAGGIEIDHLQYGR